MNPFERIFSPTAANYTAPDTAPNDSVKATEYTDIDKRRMAATQQHILGNKSKMMPYSATKQKFSKRINITADANTMAAVCDITGAVVAITFPRIPHKVFSYTSPLSIVSNCRGLAQEGKEYLRKLDTQTLAAIFITLSEDYDLLRSQPSDTGAQKNAILRTIAKDILIDGILMVEDFVHSSNAQFIPKLSIIFSEEVMQNGVQNRFQQWLLVCMEAIRKPDLRTYEEATKQRKPRNTQTVTYAKKQTLQFMKDYRNWQRDAKTLIHSMKTKQQISIKLHDYLIAVVSGTNLQNANVAMVDLLCNKLHQLNLHDATVLANKLNRYKIEFDDMAESASKEALEDFSSFESSVIFKARKAEESKPVDSENAHQFPAGMSFIEKLKAKKRMEAERNALTQQSISTTSTASTDSAESNEGNDDAPF